MSSTPQGSQEFVVSELVKVVDNRIIIECDDATGVGYALAKIETVLPQAVPSDWYQRLVEQGAPA